MGWRSEASFRGDDGGAKFAFGSIAIGGHAAVVGPGIEPRRILVKQILHPPHAQRPGRPGDYLFNLLLNLACPLKIGGMGGGGETGGMAAANSVITVEVKA